MKEKKEAVILVYGFGGHNEQMKRLYHGIERKKKNKVFISICDSMTRSIVTEPYYKVEAPFKPTKYSYFWGLIKMPKVIISGIKLVLEIGKRYKVKTIVSTGPSIGLLYGILFKTIYRSTFIYLETWSRFYSKSAAGLMAYHFADYFFIQNATLKDLYKKGIYLGRL